MAQSKAGILSNSLVTTQATEYVVSSSVSAVTRVLSLLAEQVSVKREDTEAATRLFQEALSSYPELLNIAAANRNGQVFASAIWETGQPRDVSGSAYFRHVMLSGWSVVSQTRLVSPGTGFPTVAIAVPIKDQMGMQVGAVIGELSLPRLRTSLSAINPSKPGKVVLVDSEGTSLIHLDWTGVAHDSHSAASPAVAAALRGQRGTLEAVDPDTGRPSLVAYVPVDGTPWALMVVHPTETAYAAVWEVALRSILILGFGSCLAMVLAFVFLRWISRPVDALHSRARVLAGIVAARPAETGSDELQQLSTAFDSLASALERRAVELADLHQEIESRNIKLKGLSERMMHIEEDERKRIALDLHDGVAQLLATALVEVQGAERYLSTDLVKAQQKIHTTFDLVRRVYTEVRSDLLALYPQTIQKGKLAATLEDYLTRFGAISGLQCQFENGGVPAELDPALETLIFRAARECLQNTMKHANAISVCCTLGYSHGVVKLTIQDDGRGYDIAAAGDSGSADGVLFGRAGCLGLASLQEQAQAAGGRLLVHGEPGQGTTVALELPWPVQAVDQLHSRPRSGRRERRAVATT